MDVPITEPMEPETNLGASASSRRAFLKKAAMVAWSTPVIMTVTANRAWANHPGGEVPGGCHKAGQKCDSSSITPGQGAASCCPTDAEGGTLVCCAAGTANADKCLRPTGEPCTSSGQCCSNRCPPASQTSRVCA